MVYHSFLLVYMVYYSFTQNSIDLYILYTVVTVRLPDSVCRRDTLRLPEIYTRFWLWIPVTQNYLQQFRVRSIVT
jgi:hypothetical protein